MVNGANVSCACTRSPNGISPYCHLGDGCVDVLIIKHTNMLNNLRLLLRLSSKVKNVVCNFTFITEGTKTDYVENTPNTYVAKYQCMCIPYSLLWQYHV